MRIYFRVELRNLFQSFFCLIKAFEAKTRVNSTFMLNPGVLSQAFLTCVKTKITSMARYIHGNCKELYSVIHVIHLCSHNTLSVYRGRQIGSD